MKQTLFDARKSLIKRVVMVDLVREYGALQPGKGEANKLVNSLYHPCLVGEVSEWASGDNKCMVFCCCWACLGGPIVEEMRKDAEKKLHKANGLPGKPNEHRGEAIWFPCYTDCFIKEALAAKKNFERGIHPPGRTPMPPKQKKKHVTEMEPASIKTSQIAPTPDTMEHEPSSELPASLD